MRVLFSTAELWPYCRVGGLAEVCRDLAAALVSRGHEVVVVTPMRAAGRSGLASLQTDDEVLKVSTEVGLSHRQALIHSAMAPEGFEIRFVEQPELFSREGLYGTSYGDYEDNAERFIFFSKMVLEVGLTLGKPVDILHAHDWASALAPVYLRTLYKGNEQFKNTASLLTVHNIGNQGSFWHYDMPLTGLGWEYFTQDFLEFYGNLNFLKGGMVFSDIISTVSPSYAEEIQTSEYGCGLEGVVSANRHKLRQVLNGIDYDLWNPASNRSIAAPFDAGNLQGKQFCKLALRAELGLNKDSDNPLLVYTGRLLERKGCGLLLDGFDETMAMGYDLVIMGRGSGDFEASFAGVVEPYKGRACFINDYDVNLAQRILAGADMMTMPSRYEPCGLHQLQAMRYGCVPVVRATGGLKDTVKIHGKSPEPTGFAFEAFELGEYLETLRRAKDTFADHKAWNALVRTCMAQDYSWQKAAEAYTHIYEEARSMRAEGDKA